MKKIIRSDKNVAIIALIAVIIAVILAAIIGPMKGQNNAAASGEETVTETIDSTQEPETIETELETVPEPERPDYTSTVVHDDGKIFMSIHEYGDVHMGDAVNVRAEPSVDSTLIMKMTVGSKRQVSKYYHINGWYGFDVSEFCCEYDADGIIWISTFYCSVEYNNWPEENDDVSYEKIVRYDTPVKVVVNQDVNVNSRPTAGTPFSYGMIEAGASFEASIVYRNKTWLFFGFKVEEFKKSGFDAIYGNIDADPDGIVWIAEKYLSLYAK